MRLNTHFLQCAMFVQRYDCISWKQLKKDLSLSSKPFNFKMENISKMATLNLYL